MRPDRETHSDLPRQHREPDLGDRPTSQLEQLMLMLAKVAETVRGLPV